MLSLCVTILMIGIGVMFLIVSFVQWASMKRLLTEKEYAIKEKRKNRVSEAIVAIYWLITIAIYLDWSFWTNGWKITWIVWLIAGILFAVVKIACILLLEKSEE